MPPGINGKPKRPTYEEQSTSDGSGAFSSSEVRSSVQSLNEAPFRPKGTWQKKGQQQGRPGPEVLPGTADKIRSTERNRNRNSRTGAEVSGFGGPDVLTLRNDTPTDMSGMFAAGGIAPGWDSPSDSGGAFGKGRRTSRDTTSAFRDETPSSRFSRGLMDDGRGTSRSGQRSGATARRAMPLMHGAHLSPLPQHQGERIDSQRMKLSTISDLEKPASPRRTGNSKLQPIHFNPQVQVMDNLATTEVDLLTMSPSKAQQHLQTERIKRKQSGRDSNRRSSLSKGVVFGDSQRHNELESELSRSGRLGSSSLRSSQGLLRDPSQATAMSSGVWGNFTNALPREPPAGMQEDPGDLMMNRSYDSKHLLGMKMSRMHDQANAVEAKQQAREDEIMRQVEFGLPGMRL